MERHILVVEDQKDIADLIAMHLRDLGHAVDSVHDGGRGYEAARSGRYDLIVLDVMLPRRWNTPSELLRWTARPCPSCRRAHGS